MANESRHGPSGNLLYPELLSKEGILEILKQRYINEHDLEDKDKEELLELYYKFVLPLPQRKYRMNRRGKEMTKKQITMAKKRRLITNDEDGQPPHKKTMEESIINSRFMSSFDPSRTESRLKPPPSCIDFKKKTIKLGSGSSKKQENPEDKSETALSTIKKKINLITFSSSDKTKSSESSPTKSESACSDLSVNKTIKLINKHLTKSTSATTVDKTVKQSAAAVSNTNNSSTTSTSEQKPSPTEGSKSDAAPRKKIKLKRIGWP